MADTRILIVDDESAIRALLRSMIATPGVEILEAESDEDALGLAERSGPFTLVITDITMPGMDGIELAGKMRDGKQAERFLFISGYMDGESLGARLDGFGTSAFLGKPFSVPDLLRTVRGLLDSEDGSVPKAQLRQRVRRAHYRQPPTALGQLRWALRKVTRLTARQQVLRSQAARHLFAQALLRREFEHHKQAISRLYALIPA